MKKIFVLTSIMVGAISAAFPQRTSLNNYTGIWENAASWVGGVAPPVANPATLTNAHLNLTINGYITRTGNITLPGATPTKDFIINDTLVLRGNFTFPNDAAELIIGPAGVLIVIGNVSFGNNTRVTNNGIFAVSGAATFAPGASDIYDNSGGGEFFVQGSVTQNATAQGADNWDNLETLYPVIYDFIICGGGPSCVLPVKLSYFLAESHGESIQLKWATIMEENFLKFIVQRSSNGIEFEAIGEVPGRGFDIYNIETEYIFDDTSPLVGRNYYRLKAVDVDERFEYFGVRSAVAAAARKVNVYPNPSTREQISFQANFNAQESDRIILIDPMGVEVYNGPASASNTNISLPDVLSPGVYILQYVSSTFHQITKVVIRH